MNVLRPLTRSGWIRAAAMGAAGLGVFALPTSAYAATNHTAKESPSVQMAATNTTRHLDNDSGSLTIVESKTQPAMYKATWTDSGLSQGESVYLTGIAGNQADSTTGQLKVLAQGTATTGSASVYFPISKGGTKANPVTFEMHTSADLESLPTGQTPEVPWAAGLPLLAIVPFAAAMLKKKHRTH